ncbi:MAG: hypothetical protein WD469_13990 [Paenibacillaceae bacterium]
MQKEKVARMHQDTLLEWVNGDIIIFGEENGETVVEVFLSCPVEIPQV